MQQFIKRLNVTDISIDICPFENNYFQIIEQLEMDYTEGAGGHSLNQFFRVNGHVVIPELAEMTGNPELNCLGSCWTKKSYRGLEMPGI